jgi:probable F420-dependent oxidoreductase
MTTDRAEGRKVPPHPFRFIAPMPLPAHPGPQWRDSLRRIEDLGFSSVSVSEHLTGGWVLEATVAMMAAAAATDRLRILSLVLANDYRHPVLLHKAAASIDLLSDGRLELGLGTGWLSSDYRGSGIPLDAPAVRIDRLEEALKVLKGLFSPHPLSFEGAHYRIHDLDGLPKPIQRPNPPILVGGGGRRILQLAAREADIVGVHCNLRRGEPGMDAAADLSAQRVAEKVRWVREEIETAVPGGKEPVLQFSIYLCRVNDTSRTGTEVVSSFGRWLGADPLLLSDSPAVLVGSVQQCVEKLQEQRERYGFSYFKLGGDVKAVAPIVARLAGT